MKELQIYKFQSPISGVNDWNSYTQVSYGIMYQMFQSPISGVNDWNQIHRNDRL